MSRLDVLVHDAPLMQVTDPIRQATGQTQRKLDVQRLTEQLIGTGDRVWLSFLPDAGVVLPQ